MTPLETLVIGPLADIVVLPSPAAAANPPLDLSWLRAGDWCTGRIRVQRDNGITAGFLQAMKGQYLEIKVFAEQAGLFRVVKSDNPTRIGSFVSIRMCTPARRS